MLETEGITLGNAGYGLRRFSMREFFETSKKMGLPAVEVHYDWLVGEASNGIPVDYTAQDIEDVKQLSAETDVTVATLASGAVVELQGETAIPRTQQIKKAIDLADALDARVIRVFTEHDVTESQHYVLPEELVSEELYDTLAAAFNEVGKYAHEKNVAIAVENHGGSSATGAGMKKLLDMVPYQEVGVTYDPANYAASGSDPYEALLTIGDRVLYTHWKDISRTNGGVAYQAFGEGIIDWPPIVSHLLESFKGLWFIEYELKVEASLDRLIDGTRRGAENLLEVVRNCRRQ